MTRARHCHNIAFLSLSRARKAAERAAKAPSLKLSSTLFAKAVRKKAVILSDQTATAVKRQKAAELKHKERAKWTAEQWKRHREKNLQYYYKQKNTQQEGKQETICDTFLLLLQSYNVGVSITVIL